MPCFWLKNVLIWWFIMSRTLPVVWQIFPVITGKIRQTIIISTIYIQSDAFNKDGGTHIYLWDVEKHQVLWFIYNCLSPLSYATTITKSMTLCISWAIWNPCSICNYLIAKYTGHYLVTFVEYHLQFVCLSCTEHLHGNH